MGYMAIPRLSIRSYRSTFLAGEHLPLISSHRFPFRPLPWIRATENLVDVVLDVSNVAGDNGLERGRLRVSGVAGVLQGTGIDMFNDVRKVFVGVVPCVNKIVPRFFLVVLRSDPMRLGVFECANIRFFLHANNSLMVIACRVNQMAEDFFERPLVVVLFGHCLTFG